MIRTILLVFLSLVLNQLYAKDGTTTLTLTGIYQGKNLYVQNPFDKDMKTFCSKEVWVNDIKLKDSSITSKSAYEIDLSHLPLNSTVTIQIIHSTFCKPKILNPWFGYPKVEFLFDAISVKGDTLFIQTRKEKPKGKMIVESFIYNSWEPVGEMANKGSGIINLYYFGVPMHSGVNKFRAKYIEENGQVYYTQIVECSPELEKVRVVEKKECSLLLSKTTDYEILSPEGKILKRESGIEIDLCDYKDEVYYLKIDNRVCRVFIKKGEIKRYSWGK